MIGQLGAWPEIPKAGVVRDRLHRWLALAPAMLRLTDDQMTHVFRAADPLHPTDRSAFLADVAAALNGHEIGDGLVGRVGRGALRLADAAGLPLGVAVARMRALAVSARRAVIPKRDDYRSGTTRLSCLTRWLGARGNAAYPLRFESDRSAALPRIDAMCDEPTSRLHVAAMR